MGKEKHDMSRREFLRRMGIGAGSALALMAAGQYTICFNLIDYIDKIQKDPTNLSPAHQTIVALQAKLMDAWNQFKNDPQWMLKKIKKK